MRVVTRKEQVIRILLVVYAFFLCALHFVRIFDCNLSGDEAFSSRLARMDLFSMIEATAADVHPPLYYIILQVFCRLFGFKEEIFHLVSFLPFLLIVIMSLTIVKKWFGTEASLILLTLTSLHEDSIVRIVEVRMYSWAALFVLCSFLAMYKMLTDNDKKSWVYFSVFTLCAAYTHYFSLISVAFFYIALIIWAIKNTNIRKRTIIVCGVAVAVYLPWFFVLLKTFDRTVDEFWLLYIPYIRDCLEYIFGGKAALLLFVIWLVFLASTIWRHWTCPEKNIWVLSGFGAIMGTIAVGNIVSRIFRPVFMVRYLYPIVIVAWLLLAVGVSYCKKKRIYAILLIAVIMATSLLSYMDIYVKDKEDNEKLLLTLKITEQANHENAIILTDLKHVNWTIVEHYYPKAESRIMKETVWMELEEGKDYWCLLGTKLDEKRKKLLLQQGYESVLLEENGGISDFDIYIYRLKKINRTLRNEYEVDKISD